MTVGELREILRALPPGRRVLVDGYEGGFDDPFLHLVEEMGLRPGPPDPGGIFGSHHPANGIWPLKEGGRVERVVVLSRFQGVGS